MKQELEYNHQTGLSPEEKIQDEATTKLLKEKQRMKDEYPSEIVEQAFKEAANQ